MTNPHNVDICVTCVSEKPPQLPLREELPSLGIEVIYNAHGVGAKASKQEQRRKLRQFQREKLNKSRAGGSRSFFGRWTGKRDDDEEDKRQEEELRVPHALSYTSYQKRLDHELDEDGEKKKKGGSEGSEETSCDDETTSTVESSNGENNLERYARQWEPVSPTMPKEHTAKPPIKNLEIPTHSPEDMALKAAFNVFADSAAPELGGERTDQETREALYEVTSPSINGSHTTPSESRQSSHFTSTTISSYESSSHKYRVHVEAGSIAFPFGQTKDDPNGSKGTPSIESLEEMAAHYLSKFVSPHRNTPHSHEESRPSDEGKTTPFEGDTTIASKSVKISRVKHDDHVSEMFDLTSISSDEERKRYNVDFRQQAGDDDDDTTFNTSKDLSTLSSQKGGSPREGVEVYSTYVTEGHLPGLSFRVPEENDGYGRIVLDLSDVVEEDGPGSPLVYSPSNRNNHRQVGMEGRQDDDILDSPSNQGSRFLYEDQFDKYAGAAERKLDVLRNKALFDDSSTLEFSSQPKRFNFQPLGKHATQQSHAGGVYSDLREESEDQVPMLPSNTSYKNFFLPTASPRRGVMNDDEPLSPSLKNSFSRDSHDVDIRNKFSVSFSNEVEAHYYDGKEEVTSYEEIFKLVDDFERGVLDSPSHSDVDVDVDRRFDSFLDRARKEGNPPYGQHDKNKSPEAQLVDALLHDVSAPPNMDQILANNRKFTEEKLPGTDMYPLHAACAREFPQRFQDGKPCLVRDLVYDIVYRKQLISALVASNPKCCTYLDSNNNLPVHIIAKQLMEWEAKWYQKVYERARDESEEHNGNGAGITTLYQTMSQIVDILLQPLTAEKELCQQPGGSGYLLPLHIAAIFTVSYNTLKAIIEKYPQAAGQKCNLEDIRTFIPNHSIPLELHSRLSTDFPKWEIEASHSEPESEIQWTQSTLDRSYGTTGGMRRSDLMFAFYPDVSPYRHETPRIRRLEARIKAEVNAMEMDEEAELSKPTRLVWEWLCTYEGEHKDDHYADSVQRIVQSLSAQSVKLLAGLLNQFGRPVIDSARTECTQAIQARLEEIASTMIPVPIDMLSIGYGSRQRSFILREWEERTANQFCLHGRGFVGVLCRTLFNIAEASFPTNFVLLPYKLVKDGEGRLGLESAEAAAVAMKFADCLLHLTDPTKILHFLEKKAIRFVGTSLGIGSSPDWDRVEAKTKQQVSKLLSLYASGQAYLYFLDEYTGVPIVPDKDDLYPLVIADATDTVRRVLPLMMCGMILMRGEKALPVLAEVLLNDKVHLIQNHWIDAARDLIGYLYSPQTEWTSSFLNDLRPLRSKLVDFVERGASEDAPVISPEGLSSEWVVELSLIKMIVEMHDPDHTLSGLRARRAGQQVLWTQEAAFLDPDSKEHLFQMDFKSFQELKEQSDEMDEDARAKNAKKSDLGDDFDDSDEENSPDFQSKASSAYDLLFEELNFSAAREKQETSEHGKYTEREPWIPEPPQIQRRKLRYASMMEPISLLNFDDDDLDLDEVLRLRILMDEQEAKLEFLREKVEDLEDSEIELLEQEEILGEMLDETNNQKDILMLSQSHNKGVASARKLLLRICELEDRVLLREVEVGQLKNDVSIFQIEAAHKKRMDRLLGDA